MTTFSPPLLGNGQGNYHVYIVGNSGTGKSTLAAYLSAVLNVPHLSIDEIAWKPGWQQTQHDELRENVSAWMAQHDRGWIVDGNYRQALGDLVPDGATDIIWLDPPLYYYLPRLLWRTLMRLLGFRAPCAEGCNQTWQEAFSRGGIVWFCITHHDIVRTTYTAWLAQLNVAVGGKMRRLDESCGELAQWKQSLEGRIRRA